MATKLLNIPVDFTRTSNASFNINLAGTMFSFNIYHNFRDGFFYFDVETNGGKRSGIRCVPNTPLLDYGSGLFEDKAGSIMVLRTSTALDKERIRFEDFGHGWDLFYVTEDTDG